MMKKLISIINNRSFYNFDELYNLEENENITISINK